MAEVVINTPLRIAFFGQTGPFAPIALKRLLDAGCGDQIVLVVEGHRHAVLGRTHRMAQRAITNGADSSNLAALSVRANIPTLQTADVNHRGALDIITKYQPNLLVCVGFDRLFSSQLLKLFSYGSVNAHPSKLPLLRGPSPIFWALKGGATSLTMTLHQLDKQEDHGAIFVQSDFSLKPFASGGEIYNQAAELAGELLVKLVPSVAAGSATRMEQEDMHSTRARRPKPEDAYFEPLKWNCKPLANFCSGAASFRAAWTTLGGDNFFIRRAITADVGRTIPAQYVQHGTRLWLQCADGVVQLEVQV